MGEADLVEFHPPFCILHDVAANPHQNSLWLKSEEERVHFRIDVGLCKNQIETTSHIFFDYQFSVSMWKHITMRLRIINLLKSDLVGVGEADLAGFHYSFGVLQDVANDSHEKFLWWKSEEDKVNFGIDVCLCNNQIETSPRIFFYRQFGVSMWKDISERFKIITLPKSL